MNRPVVAALISGLVFPGAGQLWLRRAARACVFLVPAALALSYLSSNVFHLALRLAEEIESGRLALDPGAIAERIAQQGDAGSAWLSVASGVLIVCWIASTVDAYLIARAPRPDHSGPGAQG